MITHRIFENIYNAENTYLFNLNQTDPDKETLKATAFNYLFSSDQ